MFKFNLFNIVVDPKKEYEVSILKLSIGSFKDKAVIGVFVNKLKVEVQILFFALRVNR